MTTKAYHDLPGLDAIYLEDSFVLDIRQVRNTIVLVLDMVLTEDHDEYQAPKAGEQYCYCPGHLVFRNVVSAVWKNLRFDGSTDAADEVDFGNIDEFLLCDGAYHLSGDWGELVVHSGVPSVEFGS